jgi:hypothetical protein
MNQQELTYNEGRGLSTKHVNMRRFVLERVVDSTGISGTGIVAEGVQFSTGWCALTWLSQWTSVVFYTSIQHVEQIHGHEGRTQTVWIDEPT